MTLPGCRGVPVDAEPGADRHLRAGPPVPRRGRLDQGARPREIGRGGGLGEQHAVAGRPGHAERLGSRTPASTGRRGGREGEGHIVQADIPAVGAARAGREACN